MNEINKQPVAPFIPMAAAKIKPRKGETFGNMLPKLDWLTGQLASPKLDGIRGFVHPVYGLRSRSGKMFPNVALNKFFEEHHDVLKGFDGELVLGDHTSRDYSFNATQSVIMSQNAPIEGLQYCVYDDFTDLRAGFQSRAARYVSRIATNISVVPSMVLAVEQIWINSQQDLEAYEDTVLAQNYEGVMLRHPQRMYKNGRSTWRENGLVAVKRFETFEAEILGVEPRMQNNNAPIVNAQGHTVRSSHQANKVAMPMVGRIRARGINGPFKGEIFYIGSGWTHGDGVRWWDAKDDINDPDCITGKIATYRTLPHSVKDKPRNLSLKSIRNPIDMGEE